MFLKINNLKERQKGFTFIEFLVYTFLLSGILLAMGGITVNVLSSSSNSEIVEEVTYNVRFAMQKIGAEIRDADTIVLPGREGDMLWLRTNDERDPVLFWLEDGAIVMKVAGYPQETITASSIVIDSLTFRNVGLPKDPGSVQIHINASYYNPQNYPQYNFSDYFVSAYTLRAKNSKPSDKLLTDGLVGHWTFNEGKGLTAYDFSGNENHGTLVGTPDWSEDRFFAGDRALDFDGTGDYIDCGSDGSLNPGSGSMTWAFWAKIDDAASNWNLPIEKVGGDRHYVGWYASGYWNLVITSDGSRTDCNLTYDVTGRWVFVVAILDRDDNSQTLRVYDTADDTYKEASVTPAKGDTVATGVLEIGSVNFPFNGLIDDVRIYNRALSPSEVKLLYENTKPY